MMVTLPYPHKLLWPNGSQGTPRAVAGQKRKHKEWAWKAALGQRGLKLADGPINIHVTVCPMPRGPHPDKDNVIASLKAYQDGIAAAIGIDDKHFAAPTVSFSDVRSGQFVIEVGA